MSLTMLKVALLILALSTMMLTSCAKPPAHPLTPISEFEPDDGAEKIGTKAPEFVDLYWINSKPLTIAALKGKPVLIRFLRSGCPRCTSTISTLNYFHQAYGAKGLMVLGIYFYGYPSDIELTQAGIKFPVAIDENMHTLKRYWAKDGTRQYTSVSMLIDKRGIIRWLDPGGDALELSPSHGGDTESAVFQSLERATNKLIAE